MFPSFESFLEFVLFPKWFLAQFVWLNSACFGAIYEKKKILGGKSSNGLLSNKSLKDVCNLLLFVFRNVVRDLRGEMLMQLTYTPWLITGLHQTKKEREYTGIKKTHTNRNVFVYIWVWLEGLSRIVYPIKPAAGKLNQISVHLFLSRVQFMRQRLNASDILPHSGSD